MLIPYLEFFTVESEDIVKEKVSELTLSKYG